MSKTAVKHALNYHQSSGDWSLGFILNTHFKLLPVASCQEFADFSLLKTIYLFVEKLIKCFFLKEVITPKIAEIFPCAENKHLVLMFLLHYRLGKTNKRMNHVFLVYENFHSSCGNKTNIIDVQRINEQI